MQFPAQHGVRAQHHIYMQLLIRNAMAITKEYYFAGGQQ